MYDRRWRTGRIGFETRLDYVIDPRFLVFDPRDRTLGGRLDAARIGLEEPMADGWFLTAEPVSGRRYLPDGDTATRQQARWLYQEHSTRHQGALGCALDSTFRDNKRVVYELNLRSALFTQVYEPAYHRVRMTHLCRRNLTELLDLGIVGHFPGTEPTVEPSERFVLELHNDGWSDAASVERKLVCLGLGVWCLTHYRHELELEDHRHERVILDWLAARTAAAATDPARFDLLANAGVLIDAWFSEASGLSWRRLKQLLTSPAHALLLTAVFARPRSDSRVTGLCRLSAAELRRLSFRDTELLRGLGVDSLLLEVLAGSPEVHLIDDLAERLDVEWIRSSLGRLCDLPSLQQALRAALFAEGALDGPVSLPFSHLRAHRHPGVVALELDGLEALRGTHESYPEGTISVNTRRGQAVLPDMGHYVRLGWDLATVLDAAIAAGRRILTWIESDDDRLKSRKLPELDRALSRLARFLMRNFSRPRWA